MAGGLGFEPRLAESESAVLPLDDPPRLAGLRRSARAILAPKGLTGEELDRQARHRVFPGNRPSTTLAYPKLTPFVLGQIVALYEHRVFVEGVILGINSFDQWGVELGKELALALEPILAGRESADGKDGSTRQLVGFLR